MSEPKITRIKELEARVMELQEVNRSLEDEREETLKKCRRQIADNEKLTDELREVKRSRDLFKELFHKEQAKSRTFQRTLIHFFNAFGAMGDYLTEDVLLA